MMTLAGPRYLRTGSEVREYMTPIKAACLRPWPRDSGVWVIKLEPFPHSTRARQGCLVLPHWTQWAWQRSPALPGAM